MNPIWVTVDAEATLAEVESFVREADPYGVILFARHLRNEAQVRDLCACIHGAVAGGTPRIALDQEGGRVNRLAALDMVFPAASDLEGNPTRVEAVALEMGSRLAALGFDVDFAPVADLGPAFPGTGLEGRVYGEDPARATECCRAFLRGLSRTGVAGCLKHFPGLGGSRVDSHRSLPLLEGGPAERAPHLAPYRALKNDAPFVMIAHGAYPGLLDSEIPSTLCPGAYALLADLGFAGLSVTDDLGMGAVAGLMDMADLAEASLRAGASLALWVSPQADTLATLARLEGRPPFVEKKAALSYRTSGGPLG